MPFTFLKYLLRNTNQPKELGAVIDIRPEEEKKDDVHFTDIVATANAVDWKEKTNWRSFPVLNQYNSMMCGANALAKALGIAYSITYGVYIAFSRADIYQRRINRPSAGMIMNDMFRIASEGVTLEQLTPKEIRTDYDAETLIIENFKHKVGEVFAINGGVYVDSHDMEAVASIIQTTGKGIIFFMFFNSGEWSRRFPVIIDKYLNVSAPDTLRHFIVGVDYGLIQGKKYLRIEDSAWFGGLSERFVDEAWLKARGYQAGYPMRFKFQIGDGDKPSYDNVTIISAQKCLRYEGFFPINVDYFENLGPTTRKGLAAFQTKLPVTSQLDEATKNKLRQLYP